MRKVIELFPVPIYTNNIDVDDETRKAIFNQSYQRLDNGLFTHTKLLDEPRLMKLKNQIHEEISYFLYDYLKVVKDVGFYITTSWAVKHYKNDWAQQHHHSNSIFSGVLYINVDEISGDIRFVRESRAYNLWPISITPDTEGGEKNRVTCVEYGIKPQNNDILIFPSHLAHEVSRNLSHIERCVVAFNIFLKGTFGETENLVILKDSMNVKTNFLEKIKEDINERT